MPKSLAADVTLRDLWSTIDDLENYVRRVVDVMHTLARDEGAVVMRLGITGTGYAPNYRIESAETGTPIAAIDGANHQRWPAGQRFDEPSNWSTATMPYEEVRSFLGEIRNPQKNPRP